MILSCSLPSVTGPAEAQSFGEAHSPFATLFNTRGCYAETLFNTRGYVETVPEAVFMKRENLEAGKFYVHWDFSLKDHNTLSSCDQLCHHIKCTVMFLDASVINYIRQSDRQTHNIFHGQLPLANNGDC